MIHGIIGFAVGMIATMFIPKENKILVYILAFIFVIILAFLDMQYGIIIC